MESLDLRISETRNPMQGCLITALAAAETKIFFDLGIMAWKFEL